MPTEKEHICELYRSALRSPEGFFHAWPALHDRIGELSGRDPDALTDFAYEAAIETTTMLLVRTRIGLGHVIAEHDRSNPGSADLPPDATDVWLPRLERLTDSLTALIEGRARVQHLRKVGTKPKRTEGGGK